MRKRMAWITAVFFVVMAASVVSWRQDQKPDGQNRWQGQHASGMQGEHRPGGQGEHRFDGGGRRGEFQGRREGFGGHGMMGRHGHGMMGRRGGFGERGGMGGGGGMLRMAGNPRVRAALGLTDAQVTRLHEISVESEKASVRTRADLQLRGIELHELMRADNPDRDAIMRKVQEVSDLRGQMAKQRMETMLTARSVLTPEQVKKVKAFMESGGRGPGGPGGPGGPRPMGQGQGRRPGTTPPPPAHTGNPPAAQ